MVVGFVVCSGSGMLENDLGIVSYCEDESEVVAICLENTVKVKSGTREGGLTLRPGDETRSLK